MYNDCGFERQLDEKDLEGDRCWTFGHSHTVNTLCLSLCAFSLDFETTYQCGKGFSSLAIMKMKYRTRTDVFVAKSARTHVA